MQTPTPPPTPTPAALHTAVFQSLEEQIAVIDRAGNIIDVNNAWRRFGGENGLQDAHSCIGHNYLRTLSDSFAAGDALAGEALQGMTEVLAGERGSFSLEYPCHSPEEKRWFIMRIVALHGDACAGLYVVSHHNITLRKLAEEKAEALAMQDPLTGLCNRRALHLFLSKEIRSSVRYRKPLGFALIDVDCFKHYNDEHGHAAGDQCLVNIGNLLLASARRPSDLVARIGGDEFALILGDTDVEQVREMAESIVGAIHDLGMLFGGSRKITVSIGWLSRVPHDPFGEAFLFQQADKALYRAKSAGGNHAVEAVQEVSAGAGAQMDGQRSAG